LRAAIARGRPPSVRPRMLRPASVEPVDRMQLRRDRGVVIHGKSDIRPWCVGMGMIPLCRAPMQSLDLPGIRLFAGRVLVIAFARLAGPSLGIRKHRGSLLDGRSGATGIPLPTFILASGGASSTPIPLTTRSLGGSPRLGVSKSLRVQVGRGFISPCRIMGASGLLSLQGGPRSHPHHPIPSLAFVCLPGGLRSDLGSAGDTESR
jgi:hypothetical protein